MAPIGHLKRQGSSLVPSGFHVCVGRDCKSGVQGFILPFTLPKQKSWSPDAPNPRTLHPAERCSDVHVGRGTPGALVNPLHHGLQLRWLE